MGGVILRGWVKLGGGTASELLACESREAALSVLETLYCVGNCAFAVEREREGWWCRVVPVKS